MNEENTISSISEAGDNADNTEISKDEIIARKYFLKGTRIGISISESDNLEELGYGVAHLKDAIIEIARYILSCGGVVVYGGDMRQGGFTELIFDLLAYYKAGNEIPPHERFYSYLAWPISTTLSLAKQAELKQNVCFRKIAPPEDLKIEELNSFLPPNSPENLYVWSRCLNKMREDMEDFCDARIFIGGRVKGFKGKCPGILEEFLVALKHDHPIYLIGAFGGITSDIIDVLKAGNPDSFTNEFYIKEEDYESLFRFFNSHHPDEPIDFPTYKRITYEYSLKRISEKNGLSINDNMRLMFTPHLSEIIYLVLKGLTKISVK